MSYFNRNKWWGIAFLVLLALNIATLSAFWLLKDKRGGPPPAQRAGVVDFLVTELGLDSAQRDALKELNETHQRDMKEIRRNNREAKNSFFDLLSESNVTDSVLHLAAQNAVKYEVETDMLTFRHFQKIRQLCTDEQKEKFDQVIKQVVRMMAPPQPGNRQGPPPGREGGRPENGPPPRGEREGPPPPEQ